MDIKLTPHRSKDENEKDERDLWIEVYASALAGAAYAPGAVRVEGITKVARELADAAVGEFRNATGRNNRMRPGWGHE